ncbi:MAG: ATP-binding protein [Pseudomonadota bacterium]
MSKPFPFAAIVAQDEMKQALLMAAVDPSLAGVLVFGDRGTGKSTAVRALADLLPSVTARRDCPCHCGPDSPLTGCLPACQQLGERETLTRPVPMVDLPLGATEDRIVGALDLERALVAGERAFEPGLLAQANRGFLYIDEVNLLEDHLVDLLLDATASGENVVEREGMSVRHPARFVIVGSGNPEEGELRPQLLDRFGLSVEISTPQDIDTRIEIVQRRDAFERDPIAFHATWAEANARVAAQIVEARARLTTLEVPHALLEQATQLCLALGTDGLRGELTLLKGARALAALQPELGGHGKGSVGGKGRGEGEAVTLEHVKRVAPSALRHRMRRDPLDDTGSTVRVEKAMADVFA